MSTQAVIAVQSLLLAGCGGVQTTLSPQGDEALAIDVIWRAMLWVCGFFYLVVLLWLAAAIVRRRSDASSRQRDLDGGDARLGRVLWLWILAVTAALTGLTAASFTVDRRLTLHTDAKVDIRVTAKQWWWQVEYLHADPSLDFTTANEIVLPIDVESSVSLEAGDVIHSLWIPNLAGKRDMIPGRTNRMRITPRAPGDYRGQCAEFCGLQHAYMALDVHVVPAPQFREWEAHQRQPAAMPATPVALRGMRVFMDRPCITCHAIAGTDAGSRFGPDLTHFGSRTTLAAGRLPMGRDRVHDWLRDPQRFKPGTNMPRVDLSGPDLDALTEYLTELK